jgi:PTH1 family peptidyl-tRNA hydrolase
MADASDSTWLVAGLGNPGDRYAGTYHNLGFRTANRLKALHAPEGARWESLARGRLVKALIAGLRVVLLKPQTYMNLSGESVRMAADRFSVAAERVVVVHDDLDIEPGEVRVKVGGGTGGHKGLESCIRHLGDPGFVRIRMGIGRHPHVPADRYVLSRIPAEREELFARAVLLSVEAVELVVARGAEKAMNRTNRRDRGEG